MLIVNQSISLVEKAKISERNKQLILGFKDKCFAEGLSGRRIIKYLFELRILAVWLAKDYDKADRKDLEELVAKLEQSDYAEMTKYGMKIAIRKFYRFLRGMDEGYPDEVRWIKPRIKSNHTKIPDDLLSEDDIRRLVEANAGRKSNGLVQGHEVAIPVAHVQVRDNRTRSDEAASRERTLTGRLC